MNNWLDIKEGDVVYADIPNAIGHQQGGRRYFLIVSNNIGNKYSGMVRGIPFTSQNKKPMPTHVYYTAGEGGLPKDSILLSECIWDINKDQIIKVVGHFDKDQMIRAAKATVIMMPFVSLANCG